MELAISLVALILAAVACVLAARPPDDSALKALAKDFDQRLLAGTAPKGHVHPELTTAIGDIHALKKDVARLREDLKNHHHNVDYAKAGQLKTLQGKVAKLEEKDATLEGRDRDIAGVLAKLSKLDDQLETALKVEQLQRGRISNRVTKLNNRLKKLER